MSLNPEDQINEILKDLKSHNHPKNKLLEFFINKRLNKSLKSYYSVLLNAQDRLLNKDEIKVIKDINKYGI